jgi:crotonobetainyl-CoA:carnitine CoA-transferase CaiB-like acyl-CoA transferase
MMSLTGQPDGPPIRSGIAQADLTAGMFAAYGIMAALLYRQFSGLGQRLETSLFESQLAQLTDLAQAYLATGQMPARYGNLHPHWAPFETIQVKDGHHIIAVTREDQWSALCEALCLEDCSKDPRFASNEGRLRHRRLLRARIEQRTRRMDREELKMRLDKVGVPNGPVWDVKEVLHAPQTHACRMVEEMEHPLLGKILLTGIPVKLNQTPGRLRRPPPLLGEHTEEILSGLLGFSSEEIRELREKGVI